MSSYELQKAVVDRLRADSAVTALVGQRVYDKPPPAPVFPYVSIGPEDSVPSRADCYDGNEVTLQLDAWSRAVGFGETKRIAEAMRAALDDAPLTLAGHRLVDLYTESTRVLRDPDGETSHVALSVRALTEPV